jgi:hypothetical protein
MKFERFVKKPVVVDVIQYQGAIIECLKNDMRIKWSGGDCPEGAITVHTTEGCEVCFKSDYIIRGNQGELYTCNENVFEADYERAPQRKKRATKNKADDGELESTVDDVFEDEGE